MTSNNHIIQTPVNIIYSGFFITIVYLMAFAGNLSYAANPAESNGYDEVLVSDQSTGFSSPFNGKDLTGWGYRNKSQEKIVFESFDDKSTSSDGRFIGKEGILTVNPWIEANGPHLISLWTKQEYSGDFSLSIEFRASVNADSGIYLRGKQLQCRDYLVAGPYKELKKYKPQDWNLIEVIVKDNIAHCTCNGEVLEEALILPVSGPFGLEADRGRMEYRNIQIRELK